jgi:hypothetical protein
MAVNKETPVKDEKKKEEEESVTVNENTDE